MGIWDKVAGLLGKTEAKSGLEKQAEQLIDQGNGLEKQGQFEQAKQCYSAAIELMPSLARAHLNLGNVLLRTGQTDVAIQAFAAAIRLKPDYAGAFFNQGIAFKALGRLDEARASFARAAEIKPDYAEAHNSLGGLFQIQGQLAEAEAGYRRALAIKPEFVEALINLGLLLKEAGKCEEAAGNLRKALALNPASAEVAFHLGNVLVQLGRLRDAEAVFRQALQVRPDFAEACFNLGNIYNQMGRCGDAESLYRQALRLRPTYAEANNNLGLVLREVSRLDEARECFEKALAANPMLMEGYYSLGNTLLDLGKLDEAVVVYHKALEKQPDFHEVRVALTMLTLPVCPADAAQSAAVPAKFDAALAELGDWINGLGEKKFQAHRALCAKQPFFLAYRAGNHVASLSRHGDLVAACAEPYPVSLPPARNKVRFAVVSRYFHQHSVWFIILRGLLTNLDRNKFEVALYYFGHIDDAETDRAKSLADIWRDSRSVFGFEGWLEAIKQDQPDVIFYPEIGMDPISLRMASYRLAPLQVASWGHPMTTGLPTIDLYFSAEALESNDAQAHYREQLVRLPGVGCCTFPITVNVAPVIEVEKTLEQRDGPRFVIAQSPFKFDPADDDLFARIAEAVGPCSFVLFRPPQYDWAHARVMGRLEKTFRQRGLDPEQYLLTVPWLPPEQFYRLLDICDVFLDCPSFSGYTTAWQALHRGIPIVTLEGEFLRQRLASGLLRHIGLADTVAASREQYVAMAAALAEESRDSVLREQRRKEIRAAAPRMDNNVNVVRAFEQVLLEQVAQRRSAS